jgi:hypothetical protein
MKYHDFFNNHLQDDIQNRYNLSDDEMMSLLNFLQEFGEDNFAILKRMRRKENVGHLDRVIKEYLGKELEKDSHTDMKLDPVTTQDGLSMPMGVPLSKDMLIEPNYDGQYAF